MYFVRVSEILIKFDFKSCKLAKLEELLGVMYVENFRGTIANAFYLFLYSAFNVPVMSIKNSLLHKFNLLGSAFFFISQHWSSDVPSPIEAGASCFNENSTAAPRSYRVLHSLHRRRFPCDLRYCTSYIRQIST